MPNPSRRQKRPAGLRDPSPTRRRAAVLVCHPSSELYGSDRVMLETVDALVARDRTVVVTLPAAGPLVREIERRGATVQLCPTPVLQKRLLRPVAWPAAVALVARAVPAGWRLLRAVDPEVVYVSTITVPLWIVLGRCRRRRVVCHVHEGEASASRLVRTLLAAPLLLAHQLVVNSRYSAGVLTGVVPVLARRCLVVANAVPGPPTAVAARPTLTPPVRALFLGRLSERKGVPDAVDAVAELRGEGVDVELDVVGSVYPGYEWVEDDLRARAVDRGVPDAVHLHGFDADVWPHLARADLLVVPSRVDEPFGNTAVEGALAGRPIVVSRTSGLLEASAGFEAAVTVDPGDPGAIADGIRSVIERWDQLRLAARRDAELAARRHSPAAYRAAVADIILATRQART